MGTTVVNGVTYVNASGAINFADIAASFGNGVNRMSALRGTKYYKSDFTRGNFSSTGNLSLGVVRGTSGSLPRVNRASWPSTGIQFTSGNITLPSGFNTISFIIYANGGGGGGGNGSTCVQFGYIGSTYTCLQAVTVNGGAGGTGGTTSVTINGTVYSATGGAGGNQGATGANGTPDPGARNDVFPGGSGNGTGGKGGVRDVTTINADTNWAAASALFGAVLTPTYGAAGTGGGGGSGNLTTGGNGNPAPYAFAGITVFVDSNLY